MKSDLLREIIRTSQSRRVIDIPELDLISSVGNGTIGGVGSIVEEVVKFRASSDGEAVVAGIVPGPVGQYNGGADA